MLSARVNNRENCKLAGIAAQHTYAIPDVFTVRRTRLLSQPAVLTSAIFGGIKGALRIPSLSFQYL
jgi:hypothetical protein